MAFICREKISNEIWSYVQEQICSVSKILDNTTAKVQFLIVTPFSFLIKSSASKIPVLLISMKMFPNMNEGH